MVPLRLFVDRLSLQPLGTTDPSDRWVRWVHVSELADPVPYLRGGELLLLAGTAFRPGESREYVRRLAEAGVVAIGFGVTPVFDAVPPELVAACDEYGMALLEVPPDVPFASIVELHHAELVRAETRDLKRVSDGQGVLIRAAAGPNPLQAVVERLADLLDGGVVVVDRNRGRTWSAGPVRRDPEVTQALERAAASRTPTSAMLATGEEHVEVQRLLGPAPAGYAMAVTRRRPFSVADRGLVGVAASALSLLFTAPSEEASAERLGAAAVAGLLRLPTLGRALADPLDRPEDATWRVVRGLLDAPPRFREAAVQRLSALLGTPFVEQDGDGFVAIVPADGPDGDSSDGSEGAASEGPDGDSTADARGDSAAGRPGPEAAGRSRADAAGDGARAPVRAAGGAARHAGDSGGGRHRRHRRVDELRRLLDEAGLLAGISRPHPAADLDPAWGEAGAALEAARIQGRSVVAGTDPRGLLALVDPGRASRYADRLLGALDAASPKDSVLLLGTLRSWLAHHGNWDRTAADLGVHRNTVRHRIRHIARLLDLDLGDPDVRMELWFALRWRSRAP